MKQKKKGVMLSFAVIAFMFMVSAAKAQGGPGGPGGDPDPGTNVPIDGGLTLMIAAGISYAAKKGYDKRKANLADGSSES